MINHTPHKTVLAVVLATTLITLPFYASAKDDMMMKDGHDDSMMKKDGMMKDGK